jgi:hypothetical protein
MEKVTVIGWQRRDVVLGEHKGREIVMLNLASIPPALLDYSRVLGSEHLHYRGVIEAGFAVDDEAEEYCFQVQLTTPFALELELRGVADIEFYEALAQNPLVLELVALPEQQFKDLGFAFSEDIVYVELEFEDGVNLVNAAFAECEGAQ